MYGISLVKEKEGTEGGIIFHPPLPGEPPESGHFEIPPGEEGERFIRETILKAHSDYKKNKKETDNDTDAPVGSYL